MGHSIRFRLQLWMSCLFTIILLVAGISLCIIDDKARMNSIDSSLTHKLAAVHFAARDSLEFNKPKADWQVPPHKTAKVYDSRTQSLNDLLLGPGSEQFSEGWVQEKAYFIVWDSKGKRLVASRNVPATASLPEVTDKGPVMFRWQESDREAYQVTASDDIVLVGQSSEPVYAEQIAWIQQSVMLGTALLVAVIWGVRRITDTIISPLESLACQASAISADTISRHISVDNTKDEIGKLAGVLNETFARLDTAFCKQKQFVADAAHELRTPLAAIRTSIQTSLSRPRSADEYRMTLEDISSRTDRLCTLSESLLSLAKLDESQERRQETPALCAATVDQCIFQLQEQAALKGMQLINVTAGTLLEIDAIPLQQLFTNLLSNAITYGEPDTDIVIQSSACASLPGQLVIDVINAGPTLSAETLRCMFDRFYRADPARDTTNSHAGLGLTIVKKIVAEYKGAVSVRSHDNITTFTVTLPVAQQNTVTTASKNNKEHIHDALI